MTTNNDVKAQRPCTLWGQTFDSNKVYDISVMTDSVCLWLDNNLPCVDSPDVEEGATKLMFEAIQAIASAQRPWLKAEGFEFVDDEVYWVKHALDKTFLLCKHENGEFTPCWSDGTFVRERYAIPSFLAKNILAFKPISDSQEAWDAVAGVEVWDAVK